MLFYVLAVLFGREAVLFCLKCPLGVSAMAFPSEAHGCTITSHPATCPTCVGPMLIESDVVRSDVVFGVTTRADAPATLRPVAAPLLLPPPAKYFAGG